jgi:segregation and condensation protein B
MNGTNGIRILFSQEEDQKQRFAQGLRIAEALLFASEAPMAESEIARFLPSGVAVSGVIAALEASYRPRGVNLIRVAEKWTFRTAPDLGALFNESAEAPRKLSRAAYETLAIIAYHQPVTRGEIEALRGVSVSSGTIDRLIEAGFVRLRGRRRTPGQPVTFGTTETFLIRFGLDRIEDLPGLSDLAAMGFGEMPDHARAFLPIPNDDPALSPDEDPLEEDAFEAMVDARRADAEAEAPLDPGADPEGQSPRADG